MPPISAAACSSIPCSRSISSSSIRAQAQASPAASISTTWGFRTDAGYRFGAPRSGMFIEPQATIAVAWAEIDNFTLGGNKVNFSDETDTAGALACGSD